MTFLERFIEAGRTVISLLSLLSLFYAKKSMSVKIFCQFRYLNTDDFASESISNTHIADYPTSDLPN